MVGEEQSLESLRRIFEADHWCFVGMISSRYGVDEATWLRAVAHIAGHVGARNEDMSKDLELADDVEVRAAWDKYITSLHKFYLLRDGPNGFLGGRGL